MKRQTLFITALIITMALSACGGQTPLPATEPAATTQAVTQPTQAPAATEAPASNTEASTATEAPTAAEASTAGSASATVSFVNDIQPIFNARCIKCHGVERVKEGLDLQTYENIMAGSRNGSVVEPGNADGSYLVELIIKGKMPNRGEPVPPAELQLIQDWINQGALNN